MTRWPTSTATTLPTTPYSTSTTTAPRKATSSTTDRGAVAVDRGGQLRWYGLDGVEHTGGPLVDFDGFGGLDDRLLDTDGDGLADRVLCAGEQRVTGYVDTDGDGRWDVRLTDTDGDGTADGASSL